MNAVSPDVAKAAASTRTEAEVRFERACRAADAILAPLTMKVGRLMEEAPDHEMIVTAYGQTITIPAKAFNALYEATDRGEP